MPTKSYVQIVLAAWLSQRDEAMDLLNAMVTAAGQNPDPVQRGLRHALASPAIEKVDAEQAKQLTVVGVGSSPRRLRSRYGDLALASVPGSAMSGG